MSRFAALLLCFFLAGTAYSHAADELYLVDLEGGSRITTGDGRTLHAATGLELPPGCVLQTHEDGHILFAGRNRFFRMYPFSTVRIASDPDLLRGSLSSSPSLLFPDLRIVEFGPARQGGTVKLMVATGEEKPSIDAAIVSGRGERSLTLFPAGDNLYRALTGLDVRAEGERTLSVRLLAADGGEREIARPFRVETVPWQEGVVYLPPGKGAIYRPSEQKTRERVELRNILSRLSKDALWTGPFDYPLVEPQIISAFGKVRRYYINEKHRNTSRHRGIDFRAPEGQNVYAPDRGVAVFSGMRITTGNTVVLDHGQGVFSLYFHLSGCTVEGGEMVERGDKIGTVGSTGLAAGPHLHWGVLVDGVYVDPLDWVVNTY